MQSPGASKRPPRRGSIEALAAALKLAPAQQQGSLSTKTKTALAPGAEVLREGWLHKRGGSHGGRTNWKRRYFRLTPTGLYFFADAKATHSIGQVQMLPEAFASDDAETLRRPHGFGVHCRGVEMVPFFMAADGADDQRAWVDAINALCERRAEQAEAAAEAAGARVSTIRRASAASASPPSGRRSTAARTTVAQFGNAPAVPPPPSRLKEGVLLVQPVCLHEAAPVPIAAERAQTAPAEGGSPAGSRRRSFVTHTAWRPCRVVVSEGLLLVCQTGDGDAADDDDGDDDGDGGAPAAAGDDQEVVLSHASLRGRTVQVVDVQAASAGMLALSGGDADADGAAPASGSALALICTLRPEAAPMLFAADDEASAMEWVAAILSACAPAGSSSDLGSEPSAEERRRASAAAAERLFAPPTTAIAAARSGTAPAATGKGKNFVQGLVSKKKLRFVKDGFDLDLSYITPQLIAMGWPSTGTEAIYRNPANEVRKFLDLYHPSRAKVYNLCVEKHYDAALLGLAPERLEQHAAYDHNPCPLFCIEPFCASVHAFVASDDRNVAVVHCKAGKGRTGMLLCAYLVWSGLCASAADALALFAEKRTANRKGVTIPSQIRYVGYTEALRDPERGPPLVAALQMPPLYLIRKLTLILPPAGCEAANFTVEMVHAADLSQAAVLSAAAGGGGGPPLPRAWRCWRTFDYRRSLATSSLGAGPSVRHDSVGEGEAASAAAAAASPEQPPKKNIIGRRRSTATAEAVELVCEPGKQPLVAGDIKVVVHTAKGKLCQFWFHTAFVENGKLRLRKPELDKANKDKKNKLCRAEFAVELTFGRAEEDLGAEESARQRNELTRSLSKADGAALFEDGTAELADDADVGDEEGEEGEEGEEDAD